MSNSVEKTVTFQVGTTLCQGPSEGGNFEITDPRLPGTISYKGPHRADHELEIATWTVNQVLRQIELAGGKLLKLPYIDRDGCEKDIPAAAGEEEPPTIFQYAKRAALASERIAEFLESRDYNFLGERDEI